MRRYFIWWALGLLCALVGAGLATVTRLDMLAEYFAITGVIAIFISVLTRK